MNHDYFSIHRNNWSHPLANSVVKTCCHAYGCDNLGNEGKLLNIAD